MVAARSICAAVLLGVCAFILAGCTGTSAPTPGGTVDITDVSPRLGPSSTLLAAQQGRDCCTRLFSSERGTMSNGGINGRVLSIASNASGERVYASTFRGGVWRSDDGGAVWQQLLGAQPGDNQSGCTDHAPSDGGGTCSLPDTTVSQLAVSPGDASGNTVFAATMEDGESPSRDGVYKSTDGGARWTRVAHFGCASGSTASAVDQANAYQVTFAAPDYTDASGYLGSVDPRRVWAVGGCQVAYSVDGGDHWTYLGDGASTHFPTPMYHVAVGERDNTPPYSAQYVQRVYACNGNQLWISSDYATPSFQQDADVGPLPASACQQPSMWPGSSSSAIATVPGAPWEIYVAATGGANGYAYFFNSSWPDAETPRCPTHGDGNTCGGGSLWFKQYTEERPLTGARQFTQVPSPPFYNGSGSTTFSGSVGVWTQALPAHGYAVIFMDSNSVSTLQMPTPGGRAIEDSWHRVDGPDASDLYSRDVTSAADFQAQMSGDDGGFVHVDQHAVAFTPSFTFTLGVPAPAGPAIPQRANYFHDANLATCDTSGRGTLFEGTDGGVYTSHDCGRTWRSATDISALAASQMAAAPRPGGGAPGLYFGGFDNNAWYSLDGGGFWQGNVDGSCGDCGGYWTDPISSAVAHLDANSFSVYRAGVGAPPDPTSSGTVETGYPPGLGTYGSGVAAQNALNPLPFRYFLAAWAPQQGWRPMVPTLPGEHAGIAADVVIVAPDSTPTASSTPALHVYRYCQGSCPTAAGTWAADGAALGGDAAAATIVQAAGGHTNTTYYVGEESNALSSGNNGGQLGRRLFRSVRNSAGLLTGWDCVWPGPADGSHDGRCSGPASDPALFFQSDPYDDRIVYILAQSGVMVSTNGGVPYGGGASSWHRDASLSSWLSHGGRISSTCAISCGGSEIQMLSDMQFSPREPGTRFAVGEAGVFFTTDGATRHSVFGEDWHRLLDTGALECQPSSSSYVADSDAVRALYVGCMGRGVLRISGIPTPAQMATPYFHLAVRVQAPAPGGPALPPVSASPSATAASTPSPSASVGPTPLPTGIPPAPPPTQPPAKVAFTISPSGVGASCTSSLQPFVLTLDNSQSAVTVGWSISFEPSANYPGAWGSAEPANGQVLAGQTETVTVTPQSLCQYIKSPNEFKLDVNYGASGPILVTYKLSP